MQKPHLISQHISWISIDPVQGCPASCAYCYLQPKGLTSSAPKIIEDNPQIIYQRLKIFRYFNKSIFTHAPQSWNPPIAIGNHTDMCMTPKNRDLLIELLHQHAQELPEVPVCIPTKAVLDRPFLERVSRTKAKAIFFISLSFMPPQFEKGTPKTSVRLANFRLLSEFPNLKCIHWWRPVTSINIPNRQAVEEQMEILEKAGAVVSVIIGLRHGEQLKAMFRKTDNPLSNYFKNHFEPQSDLTLESWIQEEILNVASKRGYPVFTGTACAISFLMGKPCYKAGFRKSYHDQSCLSSSCPNSQKNRCNAFSQDHPAPSSELLYEIANFLGLSPKMVYYSQTDEAIMVKGILLQEEQNFLAQATSFPIIGDTLVKNLEWTANSITAPFTTQDKLEF